MGRDERPGAGEGAAGGGGAVKDPTDWKEFAACRGVPTEVFFPLIANADAVALARSYCDCCPVRGECAEEGRSEFGIWAGTPEVDRGIINGNVPRSVRTVASLRGDRRAS